MNSAKLLHIGTGLNTHRAQANFLTDVAGHRWTIVNGQALIDGQPAGYSVSVTELVEVNGAIWQENADGLWWVWNGNSWNGGAGLPSPIPADAVTGLLQAGQGGFLIESNNTWAIVNGQAYENGQLAGYSAGVKQLAIVGGDVWQMNTNNLWWKWNPQAHAWDGGNGIAKSPLSPGATAINQWTGTSAQWLWNDSGAWSMGTPQNASQQAVDIGDGVVYAQSSDYVAGMHIYLNGGQLGIAAGWSLDASASIYADPLNNVQAAASNASTLLVESGTVYSDGRIGVHGPDTLASGFDQFTLFIHNGTFVNNGLLESSGTHATFTVTAHNQYGGFSGTLINNGTATIDASRMTLDAMVKGSGVFNVQDGSTLTMTGPVDSGSFILSGSSILEFAKPNFIAGTTSALQFGGTIALSDLHEKVKLDGVSGHFIDVTHPTAGVTHLTVEDAQHGAIASLNFAGNLDNGFTLTRIGGDTYITHGTASV